MNAAVKQKRSGAGRSVFAIFKKMRCYFEPSALNCEI